jgi:hypothetical protein
LGKSAFIVTLSLVGRADYQQVAELNLSSRVVTITGEDNANDTNARLIEGPDIVLGQPVLEDIFGRCLAWGQDWAEDGPALPMLSRMASIAG